MAEEGHPAWTHASSELRLTSAIDLQDLSADWAIAGATGKGVRVAIIDSGVDAGHPALGDCVDAGAGVVVQMQSETAVVVPGEHGDSFGHGTACAGIIHAVAPEASIVSVKVLDEGLRGRAPAFLRALAWCVEQKIEVVNLSLGTTRRDWALPFHDICDQAYFANSFLVTAANNLARPSFPSLYASVASVACSLTTDPLRFHYNPEPPTEFLARGIDVPVAWKDSATITATGNSYAAPHVAGIAALVRSKHPKLRPFQVKTALWACAANVQEAPHMRAGRISRTMAVRPTSFRGKAAFGVPR